MVNLRGFSGSLFVIQFCFAGGRQRKYIEMVTNMIVFELLPNKNHSKVRPSSDHCVEEMADGWRAQLTSKTDLNDVAKITTTINHA